MYNANPCMETTPYLTSCVWTLQNSQRKVMVLASDVLGTFNFPPNMYKKKELRRPPCSVSVSLTGRSCGDWARTGNYVPWTSPQKRLVLFSRVAMPKSHAQTKFHEWPGFPSRQFWFAEKGPTRERFSFLLTTQQSNEYHCELHSAQ
jgi:hypothetical protein